MSAVTFAVGERVKVWSESRQKWLDGVVLALYETATVAEGFTIPAGFVKVRSETGDKWVSAEQKSKILRKIPEVSASGAANQQKEPQQEPPQQQPPVEMSAFGGASRHAECSLDVEYKPLRDFMNVVPTKPCSAYILDMMEVFEDRQQGSSQHLRLLIDEASKVAKSKLQFKEPPGGNPAYLFALVAYTLELDGVPQEHQFYVMLNKLLQERNAASLKTAEGYLHHLLSGIQALQSQPEKEFFRGVPKNNLHIFADRYKEGVILHWSGITSVSESEQVAKRFAGPGGVLLRVTARSAKLIASFSAIPDEAECLLFPNFEAVVTRSMVKRPDGYHEVKVVQKWSKKYVF
ncbi:unnamed protein product [Polarella glacialis]|uniref:NAD(P)(+)--arginine ADP-ribosyltransferase n=1 Tax=Polarella glacialis TaxID=89957 RepID=A0A813FRL0_POLGL|nr:unnamed protein product [Polarella glacialis]